MLLHLHTKYGCFGYTTELSSCDRRYGPRAENIYYLALCRKRFPIPDLKELPTLYNGYIKSSK